MFLNSEGFPNLGEDKAGNYDNLGNPCNYGGGCGTMDAREADEQLRRAYV